MSSNTTRLFTIIALFVVAFLIGFQPIGRPPREVYSTFRVTFSKPILDQNADREKVVEEIRKALIDGGMPADEIDEIRIIDEDEIEISTLALDRQQAEQDKAAIQKALSKKYSDRTVTVGLPPGIKGTREPLFQIGNALAIYKPVPHITLGLDLQGGAHVVLRCLPYARVIYKAPEDKPFVMPEQDAEKAKVQKGWQAAESAELLEKRILRALAAVGVNPAEAKVQVLSPTMISVETHPEDQKTLKRQEKAVISAIREACPGLKQEDIKVDEADVVFLEKGVADKVKTIIDRRLYAMSEIREPVIQRQGKDRIIVELPGVRDPERVLRILKSTAQLKFVLVPARYEPLNAEADEYDEWRDKTTGQTVMWERVLAESQVVFTGRDLKSNAEVQPGQKNDWVVHFEMKPKKKRDFYNFTRANVGRLMAIVLDDKCQMAPVIKDALPGEGVIEGNFSTEEAKDLKLLLNAGALPVPLEIAENRTVSPTLGRDSIYRSLRAGIIGLIAVALYMILNYRLPGFLADIALLLYGLLVLAVLVIAHVTLTLPGIAGFILSIGMAVDANVLIFERLKEELWSGKGMRAAIDAGFNRAWTAILDSNVTTLISAAILYFLGTSSIKTFAVTLSVGVLCSMFTAITVTRWLLDIVGSTSLGRRLSLYLPRAPQPEASAQAAGSR